jgi:hypothetical protein
VFEISKRNMSRHLSTADVPVRGFSPAEIVRYNKNKFANGRKNYTLV